MLGTLASQLAIAIENVRLLSEARALNQTNGRSVQRVYPHAVEPHQRENGFCRLPLQRQADQTVEPLAADAAADQKLPRRIEAERIHEVVGSARETIGVLHVESNDLSKEWRSTRSA
ncbi:MAG: hypothetical protein U0X87_15670 [Anaerolineales bacterium]